MENYTTWKNFTLVLSELDATGGEEEEEEPEDEEGIGGVRVLLGCVLCLLVVSTLLGNTLVCAAVVRFRHLRSKVTNFFVVSLAVSDLCVAMLVMPWEAVTQVTGAWPFGSGFCEVWIAFDIMCSTASILNLCMISVDRYWAIASPFKYEQRMTHRAAFVMIGVAWTLSILISFIPVKLNWHREEDKEDEMEVLEMMSSTRRNFTNGSIELSTMSCVANLNKTYAISSSLISFYIPVVIMLATYTRIYRIAQTQIRRIATLERAAENHSHKRVNRNPQQQPNEEASLKSSFKKETKVLKTLSVIVGVFVFCWLPFFVLNCAAPFCKPQPCVSDSAFAVFVWFGWANSSLNPVIYAFNGDFRRAFAAILGCNRICPNNTAVEAVDFSDELVSYRHDDTMQHKEAPRNPPHSECAQVDKDSIISNGSRSHSSNHRLQTIPSTVEHLMNNPEISLETIMPITPVAEPKSDTLIPGQVPPEWIEQ